MTQNRSAERFPAWAVIEKKGNKLALMSGEVPVYWRKDVAKDRADLFNNGKDHVRVEKVIIERVRK